VLVSYKISSKYLYVVQFHIHLEALV